MNQLKYGFRVLFFSISFICFFTSQSGFTGFCEDDLRFLIGGGVKQNRSTISYVTYKSDTKDFVKKMSELNVNILFAARLELKPGEKVVLGFTEGDHSKLAKLTLTEEALEEQEENDFDYSKEPIFVVIPYADKSSILDLVISAAQNPEIKNLENKRAHPNVFDVTNANEEVQSFTYANISGVIQFGLTSPEEIEKYEKETQAREEEHHRWEKEIDQKAILWVKQLLEKLPEALQHRVAQISPLDLYSMLNTIRMTIHTQPKAHAKKEGKIFDDSRMFLRADGILFSKDGSATYDIKSVFHITDRSKPGLGWPEGYIHFTEDQKLFFMKWIVDAGRVYTNLFPNPSGFRHYFKSMPDPDHNDRIILEIALD